MATYKIEEVANKVGLTKRTLRYYEELGLIPPPDRSEGGFRLYSDHHVERLNKIITARDVLGFSLQELQHYAAMMEDYSNVRERLKHTDGEEERLRKLEEVEQLVAEQIGMIDRKLEKMEKVRSELLLVQNRVADAKRQALGRLGLGQDQIDNQE
ncbi:MerR family transcriptional regulator [Cohnella fermenti]|uniref:MerR family transcriptional regulator n=1 Tax=Cohnella fermenti TaxID=2565925 RepID=A0A4S4BYP8_9BACL|nr:MerR family transcriptional regulator [Cohnella fermenti]